MKKLVNFILEMGSLKRTKRSGWLHEGVINPESIADHSHRTMLIGYILAKMEKADVDKVVKMCLFHDIAETRIGDLNAISKIYIDKDKVEANVIKDQLSSLGIFGNDISDILKEFNEGKTKEAVISQDADTLERLFQAKEYLEIGYSDLRYWLDDSKKLKTAPAKKLFEELMKKRRVVWWEDLLRR